MITEILKSRFYQNMTRHPDLEWDLVEARLNENKEVLEVLYSVSAAMVLCLHFTMARIHTIPCVDGEVI